MIDNIQQIKKIALGMRDVTSKNDGRREMMQDISDRCDVLLDHHIDDGR